MAKNINSECLQLLRENLAAISANQKNTLELEIRRITHRNSANGTLKSGNTIREVASSINGLNAQRSGSIQSELKNRPFRYSADLQNEIDSIIQEFLPDNSNDFRDRLIEVVHLAGGDDRAKIAGLELVDGECQRIKQQLGVNVRSALLDMKSMPDENSRSKILFGIEALAFCATIFVAGMWVNNASGNYEPWIVLITALSAAALEIFRRRQK